MAKDMHQEEWDSATITKLDFFEQYVHEWLNVVLNYNKNQHPFDTVEIYDLFCGTGFDGTKRHKGSPLRILDVVTKRNKKGKKIKIYFNDIEQSKIEELKQNIEQEYPTLSTKDIEINYTYVDVGTYKIYSKNYYKLILLDQYGIKYITKIQEFLQKGVDILLFISSGHIRRFCEDPSFKNYIDIPKEIFEGKSSYETHRIVVTHLQKHPHFSKKFISPFTLLKDNENINGLIFFSTHQRGQEKFLETAWKIDEIFGEGNCNIDRDIEKDEGSLFYDKNTPSVKTQRFQEELKDYLKEARSNSEIRQFSYNHGFLTIHTQKILEDLQDSLEIKYCNEAIRGFHLKEQDKKVEIRLKNTNEENKN